MCNICVCGRALVRSVFDSNNSSTLVLARIHNEPTDRRVVRFTQLDVDPKVVYHTLLPHNICPKRFGSFEFVRFCDYGPATMALLCC